MVRLARVRLACLVECRACDSLSATRTTMKARTLASPALAAGTVALVPSPGALQGLHAFGWMLPFAQRGRHLFGTFQDPTANDDRAPYPGRPAAPGARMAAGSFARSNGVYAVVCA